MDEGENGGDDEYKPEVKDEEESDEDVPLAARKGKENKRKIQVDNSKIA